MAADDVDREFDAVFVDHQPRPFAFGRRAVQPADGRLQAFKAAHVRIRTFIDAGAAGGFEQALNNRIAPFVGTGRSQLHDHGVAVLVGDHTGQAIGFGVDQAQALLAAQLGQGLTAGNGLRNAALEEGIVDRLVGIEGPEAGADLGTRAVSSTPQRLQIVRQDFDGIARTRPPFETTDRTGKQPGMPLHCRAFLARHQDQLGHDDFR